MGSPSEYQKELARRIFLEGFTIGDLNARNNLPVHLEGVIVGYISHRGFTVDGEYDPRCATLKEKLDQEAEELRDLFDDYERAPVLNEVNSENSDPFRKLAEFNGTVLGMAIHKTGFECVTWERTFDRQGVMWGHYFMEDYKGAKRDFALRAGLIDREELFSKEELRTIRDLVNEALDSEDITISEDDLLELGKHAAGLLPEEPVQQDQNETMQPTM